LNINQGPTAYIMSDLDLS